jgi:REP element-mobilizing transposase RayT
MARPLRIEFAGALYHITCRGDRREAIYEDDVDREAFLNLLAEVVDRFNWICHAFCLMTNHYHLVVETRYASVYANPCSPDKVCKRLSRVHKRVPTSRATAAIRWAST